ncbi:MAG: argininosuccinate lyase, partial [Hyphomicrobiales bacterium]
FPHPTYKDTVLAPLFEGAKAHFVDAVRTINRAHLVMLEETGILKSAVAGQIAEALTDIDQTVDVPNLAYTGEHEDYFFLVEAELKRRLGADVAGMLHTARSRNDMDHTVFKLALKERVDRLLTQGHGLASAMLKKATAERDTIIVAYTHGQPAQPSTFGHYLTATLEVLLRDLERLQTARDALDHCPMGAAAITTSGFPINRERMAQLLGFAEPLRNSYGCIASVDYITGLYSSIKLVFLHLGRLIQDFQFWTAFEVGQLYVPNSLVQISSIMPQKRNPVPIEHLRHLASVTCGRCDTMVNTMHNTPFTDMNDSEGEVQQAGYATFDSGGRVLDLLSALITECSIRDDKVQANVDAACITITELADTLVRDEGLSFRQAHEIAAITSRAVIEAGKPLGDGFPAFSRAFRAYAEKDTRLSEKSFVHAVSAKTFIKVRDRIGGPAPQAMDASLDLYNTQLSEQIARQSDILMRESKANTMLNTAFQALMQE